jgi:hypothetical protein
VGGGVWSEKTNGVSLDVGWKMIYSVIQWLDNCAQLVGWVVYYFAPHCIC